MNRIASALGAFVLAAIGSAAVAQPQTYTLTVTQTVPRGLNAGQMSSAPGGIDGLCVSACRASFAAGTVVTVSIDAEPYPAWGGACAGQTGRTCRVTMDGDKSVLADRSQAGARLTMNFSHDPFALVNVDPDPTRTFYSSCRPGGCSKVYPKGTVVTLAQTQQRGGGGPDVVAFVRWEGACAGQGPVCRLVMDGDKSVDSVWRDAKATTGAMDLKIVDNSGAGAYRIVPPDKIINNCQYGVCVEHFAAGQKVTIEAYLSSNLQFDHWENCDAPSGRTCVMTMDRSKTLRVYWVYTGQ